MRKPNRSLSSRFNWRRAISIARKEFAHIARDPFTIALALGLPMFMVLIFGYAMEFNVSGIPMAVLDNDQSLASRQLKESFSSSAYFQLSGVATPASGMNEVQSERARAFLVISPDFEKQLKSFNGAKVQILMDGSDNSTVASIASYIGEIQQRVVPRLLGPDWKIRPPIELRTRYLFNDELNSKWFVVPGMFVVVMSVLSVLLTSLTVAREWESGSMELLLSTPVQPLEIIVGKLAPYGAMGLASAVLVYIVARGFFHVPFRGNHFVFLLGCVLFLLTYLAQGLLISVLVRKQQVAMQIAMIAGMLPSQLLSGFIFPIESMPPVFRWLTAILPARWFMEISRQLFLQGSTLRDLAVPFTALLIMAVLSTAIAVVTFKRDVEP